MRLIKLLIFAISSIHCAICTSDKGETGDGFLCWSISTLNLDAVICCLSPISGRCWCVLPDNPICCRCPNSESSGEVAACEQVATSSLSKCQNLSTSSSTISTSTSTKSTTISTKSTTTSTKSTSTSAKSTLKTSTLPTTKGISGQYADFSSPASSSVLPAIEATNETIQNSRASTTAPTIGIAVGVVGGMIVIVVAIVLFIIIIIRRRRQKSASAGKNIDEEPYVIRPYETVARISSVHPPASYDNFKVTSPESDFQSVSYHNGCRNEGNPPIVSNPAGNTTPAVENKTDYDNVANDTGYDNVANKTGYDNVATATSPRDALNPNEESSSNMLPLSTNNPSDTMLLDNHLYKGGAAQTNREDLCDITVVENDLYAKE